MASILAGCSGIESIAGWNLRNGPKPEISPDAIGASLITQATIMAKLEEATTVPGQAPNYYQVTLAGMNFIDEQCDAYLRELYLLDHARDRLKGALTATGSATHIIMGLASASSVSMGVVAAAFNLSSQLLDNQANSYLYGVSSTVVFSVVGKTQAKYRESLKALSAQAHSRPEAYAQIRGYLQLCMPPTIEAQVSSLLQSAKPAIRDGVMTLTAAH